jgi:hypothetical protein
LPTSATAQSVLERVLAEWAAPTLTGIYLNAAETARPFPGPHALDPAFIGIDGSISNTVYGAALPATPDPMAAALNGLGTLAHLETLTLDATGIGGVNAGRIDLSDLHDLTPGIATGMNGILHRVEAGTASAGAAQGVVVGGAPDAAALVLNIASNAVSVRGNVETILGHVDGTIGAVRATGIGAVNTGAVQAGVDAVLAHVIGPAPS